MMVSISNWLPSPISSGSVHSIGLWLMPRRLGTKIIPGKKSTVKVAARCRPVSSSGSWSALM